MKSYYELIYLKIVVNKIEIENKEETDLMQELIDAILEQSSKDLQNKLISNSLKWI